MQNFETEITSKNFIQNIWQKQAQIFKSVLTKDLEDFTASNMLAMAADPYFNSKLILFDNAWQIIEETDQVETDRLTSQWTLLVHDLDKYFLSIQGLLKSFKQFPNWCMEDVMGSYSNKNSKAPAHIDNYDVFIIQLTGKRKWSVDYNASSEYQENLPLRILKDFNPTESYELSPGDILYLPAGCAHEGFSIKDSLSLSVGIRSIHLNQFAFEMINELSDEEFFIPPPTDSSDFVTIAQQKAIYQSFINKCFPFDRFQSAFINAYSRDTSPEKQEEASTTISEFLTLLKDGYIFRDETANYIFAAKDECTITFGINENEYSLTKLQAHWLNIELQKPLDQAIGYSEDSDIQQLLYSCFLKNIFFKAES